MEWQKIPPPKTDEDPITILSGPMLQITEENGECKMISIGWIY